MEATHEHSEKSTSRRRQVISRRQPKRQRLSRLTNSNVAAHTSEVHLKLPTALPRGWVMQLSAPTLWKYLLYARGLMPMPIHQIMAWDDDNPCNRGNAKRKIFQAKKNLIQLEDDWKLLNNFFPKMELVLISLGPSWSRLKEFYLLDGAGLSVDNAQNMFVTKQSGREFGGCATQMSLKNESILSRLLLRDLVQAEAANCSCHKLAGSYQLNVSFFVASAVASDLFEANNEGLSKKLIVRHGFHIDSSSCKAYRQGIIYLERTEAVPQTTKQIENSDLDRGIWISLRATVKGVRI